MVIEDTEVEIFIHNSDMVRKLLRHLGMNKWLSSDIPLPNGFGILIHEDAVIPDHKPYQKLVGCLLYLGSTTRADFEHATHYIARFIQKPSKAH